MISNPHWKALLWRWQIDGRDKNTACFVIREEGPRNVKYDIFIRIMSTGWENWEQFNGPWSYEKYSLDLKALFVELLCPLILLRDPGTVISYINGKKDGTTVGAN